MSLDHLIVKPANKAQFQESVRREAEHWGAEEGMTTDEYVKLARAFERGGFAENGRLTLWVLVSKDDPESTNFLSSCELYTREVLTLRPAQTTPDSSCGHAISSVYVPSDLRGKGYAEHLMTLMHSVLVPHRYPNPLKVPTVSEHTSTVCVLYSAIGDYYARESICEQRVSMQDRW